MSLTQEPDPVADLLQLSVAEREQALERLLDSLSGEATGPSLLKRARSAVDRRLRRASRGERGGRGSLSRR